MGKTEIISAFRLGIDSLVNTRNYDGFFGISCGYPFFSKESLEDYCNLYYEHKCIDRFVEFGEFQFRNFLVFLMDIPLTYNLMAFAEMPEEVARKSAQNIGDILEKRLRTSVNRSRILRWNDLSINDRFNRIFEEIKRYSKENKKFECGCIDLTINGTRNKLRTIKDKFGYKRYKESLSIAKQYSFLDVAASLFLFESFPIEISKYECPLIIRELYNGLFPELKRRLKLSDMGYIQLSFGDKAYTKFYDDQFEEKEKWKIEDCQN